MLVVLARHGNTFAPGEPTVWVGGRTDLPLVEKGRAQAEAIGVALRRAGLLPERTIAGPLKRTRETAAMALAAAGLDPASVEIDERLREIDYGRWEAKSSAEIRAMGDDAMLAAWEERGAWPAGAGWPGSREGRVAQLRSLFAEIGNAAHETVLVVSSNGLFRLAGPLLPADAPSLKIATGHVALVSLEDDIVRPLCWNVPPGDLAAVMHDRSRAAPSP